MRVEHVTIVLWRDPRNSCLLLSPSARRTAYWIHHTAFTFFHIWSLQNQIFQYSPLDFDSHPPHEYGVRVKLTRVSNAQSKFGAQRYRTPFEYAYMRSIDERYFFVISRYGWSINKSVSWYMYNISTFEFYALVLPPRYTISLSGDYLFNRFLDIVKFGGDSTGGDTFKPLLFFWFLIYLSCGGLFHTRNSIIWLFYLMRETHSHY